MARPSTAATRNLTLTEELEKLEQSITLTLQEIDHNFSRTHRIVTTSILPIVEQYAKHSEAVWEGSKFWKQFFEASANVSLSGYEEATIEDSTLPEDAEPTASQAYESPMKEGDETITSPDEPEHASTSDNEEILSSPSMAHAHSTPRPPTTAKQARQATSVPAQPQFADYPSPYEQLKREMDGKSGEAAGKAQPVTPGKGQVLPDMSMTPDTSPFLIHKNGGAPATAQRNPDAILHQGILNKTYRVAATPHTARKTKNVTIGATPATANRTRRAWIEDTLSSPTEPSPQLRTEIFSPFKGPRTPGVSVVTPAAKKRLADFAKPGGPTSGARREKTMSRAEEMTMSLRAEWDEDDDQLEMSPPKTIHFDVPQSQLLRTPAQEASKRIMEDLLLTAGADISEDFEEDSPSIVQRNRELDETF